MTYQHSSQVLYAIGPNTISFCKICKLFQALCQIFQTILQTSMSKASKTCFPKLYLKCQHRALAERENVAICINDRYQRIKPFDYLEIYLFFTQTSFSSILFLRKCFKVFFFRWMELDPVLLQQNCGWRPQPSNRQKRGWWWLRCTGIMDTTLVVEGGDPVVGGRFHHHPYPPFQLLNFFCQHLQR